MTDKDYMKLALQLAKSAEGQTAPNPMVGAVVVKNGEIVGMGAHLKAGQPHAEVHALNMAGEKAKGADIYVTLEPCSHFGKTPPCSNLIIEKGIKRVIVATTDPNPKVAGNGIERLRSAGLEVEVGILKEEADGLNAMFYHHILQKTPYVTLKSASSIDGKIATFTGESKWITGPAARQDVHEYRRKHDAILVGVNTVLKDDPSLTVRLPNGGKNPIRIILDTYLRTPLSAKLLNDKEAETWIVIGKDVPEEKVEEFQQAGAVLIRMPDKTIEINALLKTLFEKGITSVFVEGGAEVNWSFIEAKAVNQVITYFAPKLIGGRDSPTPIGGKGTEQLTDALSLEIVSVDKIGSDIKIVSIPKRLKQGEV